MAKSVLDTNYPVRTWSRSTVADGNWLNTNTIQPLIDRTNVLEEDHADLLSSTNHLVDSLGNDMEIVPGDGIKFTADNSSAQLFISSNKSSLIYNTGNTHNAEYVSGSAYFDLNTNVVDTSTVIEGEKITVESNSIYLKSGIYAVSCNIALNINGTPDDTVYHFYLKIDNVIISCPFSYKTGHTAHESLYNLSSIIRVGGDKKLELSLYCDEDPKITGSEDFVIVKNQILQYLAISEL